MTGSPKAGIGPAAAADAGRAWLAWFVKTVVLDPPPIAVEQLIERRKRLGLDGYDEVWEGTYHMAACPPLPIPEPTPWQHWT